MSYVKSLYKFSCICIFGFISKGAIGQIEGPKLLTKFSYSAVLSLGDLSNRFGLHYSPGLQLDVRITDRITIGPEFNFQFGNKVKEDALAPLRDDLGLIIGENGTSAELFQRQRGTYLGINIGLLHPFGINSPNFLHTQFSIGHWQHKIRFTDDTNSAAQIRNDNIKLYDRLSNGLALKQVIGLTHLGIQNSLNYFVQLEVMEGFIKNRRKYDAVLQTKDTKSRLDIALGIRVGWILPLIDNGRTIKDKDIYY